jgi:hypothetical protein
VNDHSMMPERLQQPSFDTDVVAVCEALEQWRKDVRASEEQSPDEFPAFDWRAAVQGLLLYAVFGTALLIFVSWRESGEYYGRGPRAILSLTLIISGAVGAIVLFVGATGVGTKRYWRAFHVNFIKQDNFPFTQLTHGLQRQLAERSLFDRFPTPLLEAVHERIVIEETERRERLNAVLGNTSFFVLFSLITGVWSAWKSYHSNADFGTKALLGGSLLALGLAIYGTKLRFALFELNRCRSFLSLEIARRKSL